VQSPPALLLLVFVGTITAALGMLAMWAQTNVKRTLAWSTVSQMGFMMVQFGLAVFPAAVLHLIGHGLYKARAFLRTGELPPPAAPPAKLAPGATLGLTLLGTLAALPALALAAVVVGFEPLTSPGKIALLGIVGLALGQGWVVCFQAAPAAGRRPFMPLLAALGLTFGGAFFAVALYHGAALFYAPVFGALPTPIGWTAWLTAALPLAVMFALTVFYPLLAVWRTTAAGRAFAVHAAHGFYLGILADRIVARIWNDAPVLPVQTVNGEMQNSAHGVPMHSGAPANVDDATGIGMKGAQRASTD
jgi:NAD(P)H-quinone oxidoreductase subunit 5